MGRESTVVLSSGFVAQVAIIQALVKRGEWAPGTS
jgi:hypothetical protein